MGPDYGFTGVFHMNAETVVKTYSDMIYRIAIRYVMKPEDAEDVYSEVFLSYFRKPRTFESEEHRKAWLIKVTINCAKDLLMKRVPYEDIDEVQVAKPDKGPAPEEIMDLRIALSQLKDEYREVISLYYLDDLPVKEIAALLDKPENTIKSLLHRGRAELKEKLESADKAVG